MKTLEQIKSILHNQLFASIPAKQKQAFQQHLFLVNSQRFMAQSLVVAAMDVCSLLVFLIRENAIGTYPVHIVVRVLKIALMAAGVVYFSKRLQKGYVPGGFLDKHQQIIYPLVHFIGEFLLFATGSHEFGALLRFVAVPFIIGAIPVYAQKQSFVLLLGTYICYSLYLPLFTKYSIAVNLFDFLLNTWLVVFVCALLLSFEIYSAFVNRFIASKKEEEAREQLSLANHQLDILSKHDQLTGLLNRWGFQKTIEEQLPSYNHPNETITAVMVDMDYFKKYNDRHGHKAGDACLARVTGCITMAFTGQDMITARYGGEEFLAVAFGKKHADMVEQAEALRKCVMDLRIEHPDSDVSPCVTISIGVATLKMSAIYHYEDVIRLADECLYTAKRAGHNRTIQTKYNQSVFCDAQGFLYDLNPKIHAVEKALDAEYIEKLLQQILVGCTFVYDARSDILSFSKAATDVFDLPVKLVHPTAEKIKKHIPLPLEEKETFFDGLLDSVQKELPAFVYHGHLQTRNHIFVPVSVHMQSLYSLENGLELIQGTIISISKIIEYNRFLHEQNMADTVTQLPNRKKMREDMQKLLQDKETGYIIFLDIRNFKEINGYYSHNIGDKVLFETARLLVKLAEGCTGVYNYSVDQFAIVANGKTEAEVLHLAQEIQDYFTDNLTLVEGLDLHIAFAVACVKYSGKTTNLDNLIVDLDIAIQVAKYNKSHTVEIFSQEERTTFLNHVNLLNELDASIENNFDGFVLYYQPILDISGEHVLGAEALLRWQNKNGELISPTIVIPVLESADMMATVEKWIIQTACGQCAQWLAQGVQPAFFIQINMSVTAMGRSTLLEEIDSAVQQFGLKHNNIAFEVTESYNVFEKTIALAALAQLRRSGYKIAIDDFGSGYSSLSYLNNLPADEVKIDRSFLKDIDINESAKNFLTAIVSLAKSKGFLVCIEGVETGGQHEVLCTLKVDFLQGFLFSQPVPPKTFFQQFLHS